MGAHAGFGLTAGLELWVNYGNKMTSVDEATHCPDDDDDNDVCEGTIVCLILCVGTARGGRLLVCLGKSLGHTVCIWTNAGEQLMKQYQINVRSVQEEARVRFTIPLARSSIVSCNAVALLCRGRLTAAAAASARG